MQTSRETVALAVSYSMTPALSDGRRCVMAVLGVGGDSHARLSLREGMSILLDLVERPNDVSTR